MEEIIDSETDEIIFDILGGELESEDEGDVD